MPVNFGSVGDIIAVCVLVKDCVDALSSTNGAAPQYQAVIRELHILEKALLEVGLLSKTHATTPELIALFTSADTTIEQCRKALDAFKRKLKPYDQDLGASSINTTMQKLSKGCAKKLQWQLRMKDDVARFRAEVVAFSVSMDKILAAATMHTVKAQADRIDSRVERLQLDNERSSIQQDKTFKELRARLDQVDQKISAGNSLIARLVTTARQTWLLQLGDEIKADMFKIVAINLAIYASVNKVHESILDLRQVMLVFSPLSRFPQERSFYLIDAVGRPSTITLDWIDSHAAFTAVLHARFQGRPGSKKIYRQEYAIRNRATSKDIDMSKPWDSVFLPGLCYHMSMVFQVTQDEQLQGPSQDTCPRCGTPSYQPQGSMTICSVCKQEYEHYRAIVPRSEPIKTFRSTLNAQELHEDRTEPSEADPDDDPANFNHVRISSTSLQWVSANLKPSSLPKRLSHPAVVSLRTWSVSTTPA